MSVTTDIVRANAIRNAESEANGPKHRLMEIKDALEHAGAKGKAKRLGCIIARLERWQNT